MWCRGGSVLRDLLHKRINVARMRPRYSICATTIKTTWRLCSGTDTAGFIEDFTYDELNRLETSTVHGQPAQTYAYYSDGSMRLKTGVGTGDYQYPMQGPNAVQSIVGGGSFSYDGNGNLLSSPSGGSDIVRRGEPPGCSGDIQCVVISGKSTHPRPDFADGQFRTNAELIDGAVFRQLAAQRNAEAHLILSGGRTESMTPDLLLVALGLRGVTAALPAAGRETVTLYSTAEGGSAVEMVSTRSLFPTHGKTLSNSKMKELTSSLAKDGSRSPLTVTEHNGRLYVLDGNNRLFAAPRAAVTQLPVNRVQLPWGAYKSPADLMYSPHGY